MRIGYENSLLKTSVNLWGDYRVTPSIKMGGVKPMHGGWLCFGLQLSC